MLAKTKKKTLVIEKKNVKKIRQNEGVSCSLNVNKVLRIFHNVFLEYNSDLRHHKTTSSVTSLI